MAENTRVPLNRIERILAFVIGSVAGISIVAIAAIFVGRAMRADFTVGVWPAAAALPLIGLPLAVVLLLIFLVLTVTRRARLARDAGN
ncbi:multidrug ABC transporter ATPase [Lysinimonas soli]|uniref:Multidrug ABC transporter ATPase n=1 Tax=Lysinimonas soli TaxID=1074233 RepID=A0ABW0NM26_9MICO